MLEEVENQKYLGDILTADATNTKNITQRKAKGFSIINQIKLILDNGFFGIFHFEAAVMLRQALFINSILLNSEIWYNVTELDIQHLETVDNSLLRSILECPKFTPVAAMFLELGIIPIRFILMQRRAIFLHYLLQQKENSLLSQFFHAQKVTKYKGDWIYLLESSLHIYISPLTNTMYKLIYHGNSMKKKKKNLTNC